MFFFCAFVYFCSFDCHLDLDALPTKLPVGHKKKILLKARDLGSATLRGRYIDGVYVPPPKSLITSAQLEELKAEEQMNKVKLFLIIIRI